MIDFSFILVEPAVPENIGASARAIKTMGFNHLVLVNPCDHLSLQAKMLAHGANEILVEAQVYNSFENAIAGYDIIIGTSAKNRSVKKDYYSVNEVINILDRKEDTVKKVAIVFGREESGLKNNELAICDLVTYIPMVTTYPSLNLSQAVMLVAYFLSQHTDSKKSNKIQTNQLTDIQNHIPENREDSQYKILKQHVSILLEKIQMTKNTTITNRVFERIAFLSKTDINLFLSFFEKLNKYFNSDK